MRRQIVGLLLGLLAVEMGTAKWSVGVNTAATSL
jgi:hypothetical protein